ncbi:MAG: methyltransferase domain-containing protein [Acidimicrobiales bacterium]|nr:methyltransferase domain-containing protein [Acidimicrobiales bacterium]
MTQPERERDEGQLRRVYEIDDPIEIRDYYDGWAESYDAELKTNGYASPARVAAALASVGADFTAPVLDYGCGTGLSGEALLAAGFTVVDGADPAPQMLRVAEAKGIYRSLFRLDLDASTPPFDMGSYAVVTAVGLIGPGAAPLDLFDQLVHIVAPGGLFGFSFNDHAMDDPAYPERVEQHVGTGGWEVLIEERGPHLPSLDVRATVFVLNRKTK